MHALDVEGHAAAGQVPSEASQQAVVAATTPEGEPDGRVVHLEHGAADIGITGKDVLLEQEGREVYELLDLGFGGWRMVVAARADGDALGEALRRLGPVRIATKYPRVASEHFAGTGRQADIVEVKGSVEIAPLTGLVDAIVDLTASGRTLEENDLEEREEIAVCTARLVANPVAHKLKAEAVDALVERMRATRGAVAANP